MSAVELGVTRIGLTSEGKTMFPFAAKEGCLRVYEFPRRDIVVPAEWFKELSEGNQVSFNNEDTILTFQGHPFLASIAYIRLCLSHIAHSLLKFIYYATYLIG